MSEAKQEASSMGEHIGGISESIRGFAQEAGAFVAVQTAGLGLLAKQAIDVASNFEQTQTSFGTLLGDEQKAADLMKEIMAFEVHTPFDIQTLTNGAKEMLAFGVNSKNVVPIMKELTDMSQGQSFKLQELISIYGQVNSIQQLNGREVLRLSSIGVPIYQAIEEHIKKIGGQSDVTGEQVKKMIEKGQISAKDFNEILSEMTSKGGLFFNENIRQMSTFAGILSSTRSQFQYAILNILGIDIGAKDEIRKGGLFDTLRTLAAQLLDGLAKLQPVFKAIGENKTFQLAVEGMVVALASLAIIIPIVILALNPIILVVLLIEAAIVALYVAWNTNFLGIRDLTNAIGKEIGNFFKNYLMPVIAAFEKWWKDHWQYISEELKGTWEIIQGVIEVAWNIVYGILKIGIDLLTGNWKRAWDDMVDMLKGAWDGITKIFNGALDFIKGWGGNLIHDLVAPFQEAWNQISNLINKIKDGLDFTKRHSPSVVDIVQNGVAKVNEALGDLAFTSNVGQNVSQMFANPITSMQNNIAIDMNGAILSDQQSATQLGEKIGDAIISKLKLSIRF